MPRDRFQVAARRAALRQRAIAYKGGKCEICGYSRCPEAFDLHHTNPAEKDFAISARMTTWEAVAPELRKCVLLCSNCHREVHAGWHPQYLALDEGRGDPGGWYEPDELEEVVSE